MSKGLKIAELQKNLVLLHGNEVQTDFLNVGNQELRLLVFVSRKVREKLQVVLPQVDDDLHRDEVFLLVEEACEVLLPVNEFNAANLRLGSQNEDLVFAQNRNKVALKKGNVDALVVLYEGVSLQGQLEFDFEVVLNEVCF